MYSFGLEILGKRLEKGIISFQRRLREGHPWFRTSKKKKKTVEKIDERAYRGSKKFK